jgi:hypothetical protein
MNKLFCLLLASFLFYSCTPPTQPVSQTQVVTVYATSAAQPWLSELFVCANDLSIALSVNAEQPDIYMRLGEPETLFSPTYKIDEEEILIVTHRESPLQNLSLEEAQALFAGSGDPAVQVWVYAADEDVQIAFDQLVMKGRGVTSFAKLATSPQQMSDILNAESNAVGILPRHWKMGSAREVYSAGTVPVLAVTKAEPTGTTQGLIACLQK